MHTSSLMYRVKYIECAGNCAEEILTRDRSCNNLVCSSPDPGQCQTPLITPVRLTNLYQQLSTLTLCTQRHIRHIYKCTHTNLYMRTYRNVCTFSPLIFIRPTHSRLETSMLSKEVFRKERQSTSGLSREGRSSCCVCQRKRKSSD